MRRCERPCASGRSFVNRRQNPAPWALRQLWERQPAPSRASDVPGVAPRRVRNCLAARAQRLVEWERSARPRHLFPARLPPERCARKRQTPESRRAERQTLEFQTPQCRTLPFQRLEFRRLGFQTLQFLTMNRRITNRGALRYLRERHSVGLHSSISCQKRLSVLPPLRAFELQRYLSRCRRHRSSPQPIGQAA